MTADPFFVVDLRGRKRKGRHDSTCFEGAETLHLHRVPACYVHVVRICLRTAAAKLNLQFASPGRRKALQSAVSQPRRTRRAGGYSHTFEIVVFSDW
jgi:hypothetical protein